jgi:hypothetical protein
MTRRKGELSSRMMDREWPHQVPLPADEVMGDKYRVTHEFCRDLSLCPRGHSVCRDNVALLEVRRGRTQCENVPLAAATNKR